MRRVFLRADANRQIGWGHLSRMTALAEILDGYFDPILVSNSTVSPKFKSIQISSESAFYELLDHPDIVVLDGYSFDEKYHRAVKSKGVKLVCVDDYQHQPYYTDAVLNHAPGVKKEQINALPDTEFLLGPKYALLRQPFLEPYKRHHMKCETAMVCFGGSDVEDLSYSVTSELLKIPGIKEIKLILGKDYMGKSHDLGDPNISISSNLTVIEMRETMRNADFGVVSSSTLLFECLSQGLPCISGYYIDNQKSIYEGFLNLDAIVGVGDLTQLTGEILQNAIVQIGDTSQFDNITSIFDGGIKERLISFFESL